MKFFRNLVTVIYALLLIPAGVLGAVAYSDYNYLDCPGANQCSDALTVWQSSAIFAVGGLIFIALLWLIRPAPNKREGGNDA